MAIENFKTAFTDYVTAQLQYLETTTVSVRAESLQEAEENVRMAEINFGNQILQILQDNGEITLEVRCHTEAFREHPLRCLRPIPTRDIHS